MAPMQLKALGALKESGRLLPPDDTHDRWSRNDKTHWCEEGITNGPLKVRLTLNHLVMALRSWSTVFSFMHILIAALTVGITVICHRYNIRFNTTWSVASFAIVFPIVFAINNSIHRREAALTHFANIRTGLIEFFIVIREATEYSMDKLDRGTDETLTHDRLMQHIRAEVYELIGQIYSFTKTPNKENTAQLDEIQTQIGNLFRVLEFVRPAIETGLLSRVQQYIYHAHTSFERMRLYKEYGTPYCMRTHMYLTVLAFPVLYSPYFAHVAHEIDEAAGTNRDGDAGFTLGLGCGLVFGVFVSLMLAGLLSVVDPMETIFTPRTTWESGDHIAVQLPMMQIKAGMALRSETPTRQESLELLLRKQE
jgi:hypothetical protein